MKFNMFTNFSDTTRNRALTFLRIGIGLAFVFHGYPKLMGGIETWTWLGGSMENLGISFYPAFWGFMAAATEFFGGIFLILGLFFKPSTILLAFTMLTALVFHISNGDAFSATSHPLKMLIVFIFMFFAGPGSAALDNNFKSRR